MGRTSEICADEQIELLEQISDMCGSANYDIQEIYEWCQNKIKEIELTR